MFKDKNIQYINIVKYNKQLKIDNQILQNDKLLKTEHSSFIIEDVLSSDSISKLNILQKNISNTNISLVCESLNQRIVTSDEFANDDYEVRKLNTHYSIAIPKNDITNTNNYFKEVGIDYLFSPFNILYNHIMSNNPNTNSLNMLILNNIIYAFILDDDKRIVYSTLKTLTPFCEIKDSEFISDGLDGQKLFDEIHQTEIQDSITNITTEFYETNKSKIFCESVSILYTIKQLNEIQLEQIQENIMIEVEYNLIDINHHLFNLSKQLTAIKFSFIHPRENKNKRSFLVWVVSLIITTMIIVGIFYYMQLLQKKKEKKLQQEKIAKIIADKKAKLLKIKLPKHKRENNLLKQTIISIMDTVPDNVILSELELQKQDSTFVCNLLSEDTFETTLKPSLLKLYKKTEVLLMQENKPIFSAIISNTTLKKQTLKKQTLNNKQNYRKNNFITKTMIVNEIQALLIKDTKVKFISTFKSKFLTYNFTISTIFNKPNDLLNFIDKLNKKAYSIVIQYPIEFIKTKKGLETIFNLQLHQFHKK
jgi:hypothetical protein